MTRTISIQVSEHKAVQGSGKFSSYLHYIKTAYIPGNTPTKTTSPRSKWPLFAWKTTIHHFLPPLRKAIFSSAATIWAAGVQESKPPQLSSRKNYPSSSPAASATFFPETALTTLYSV